MNLFFDTYALFEIVKENDNYSPYVKNVGVIITILNLMELHYAILRTVGKEEADRHFNRFLPFIVEIQTKLLKKPTNLSF